MPSCLDELGFGGKGGTAGDGGAGGAGGAGGTGGGVRPSDDISNGFYLNLYSE